MTGSARTADAALWIWVVLVLAFLVLPLAVIVPLSFSAGSFLSFPLPGLSWQWYLEVWHTEVWWRSLENSLKVGVLATLIATVLEIGRASCRERV